MSLGKGSKLYSIFKCKCPKCHEGDMFPPGTLYHPRQFYKMYSYCDHCEQSYEPEPGFYFGSMFVSYALNTALFVFFWIATSVLVEDMSILRILGILFAVVIGLLPITFRLSRSIWINFFVQYDPNVLKNTNNSQA